MQQKILLLATQSLKIISHYLIYVFISIYTIILSYFSILKHNAFMTTAWDLGIYEQVIWSTVHGRLLWYSIELPINPSGCFFGIHFAPILLLIAPIYGIFQSTETLLILQSFVLGLGALPLYWIVKEEADNKTGLAFAGVYLLYLPLYGVNLFDFHTQAFLPALFLFAFYYFKKEKWTKYFIFIILALMVNEFVPFIVVFFGIYGVWVNRKEFKQMFKVGIKKTFANKRILCSITTIILGIAWFILAIKVIFYFNPSPRPHPNWQKFGDPIHDLPGTIINMLFNPLLTIETAFSPLHEKMMYIIWLFAPLLFLSFFDPPSLLIGSPWFAASLLGSWHAYYKAVGYQYVAYVIPFIFISAFYGAQRFILTINKIIVKVKGEAQTSAHVMRNIGVTMILLNILLLGMIFINIILFNIFLANPESSLHVPQVTRRVDALREVIKLIPPNASLLTQNDLVPHVCRRFNVYVGSNPVGNYSGVSFDYILVDTYSKWYEGGAEFMYLPLPTVVKDFATGKDSFKVVSAIDGIWLLKRGYTGSPVFPFKYGILGSFSNKEDEEPVFESSFLTAQWNWTTSPPFFTVNNESFHAFFKSYLYIDTAGEYAFQIFSQGNSRFSISDGINSYIYEANATTAPIYFDAGYYEVKIEYWKNAPESSLHLSWKTPHKEGFENIPISHLFLEKPKGD